MNKICAVYKITNTITNDFYIGSSKDAKKRWMEHKWFSTWKKYPNNPLYQDMQKYGTDKFAFEILEEVEEEKLKEAEQQLIETLKPTYNNRRANGFDFEKHKQYQKTHKDELKEYQKQYQKSDKYKEYKKEYEKTDKRKQYHKEYNNQLCCYNGETLTLNALKKRFKRRGLSNPTQEAKKYLIRGCSNG